MEFDHQDSILRSKEQALISKGKRTKRQRLHSPIPFPAVSVSVPIPTNSSSGEAGFDDDDRDCCNDCVVVVRNLNPNPNPNPNNGNSTISPSSSSTEEEQDMANCLILLAQGRPPANLVPFHHLNNKAAAESNVALGGTEKAGGGCYGGGYECKTCFRTFSSFQALGGHRASHKKPKAMESAEKKLLHLCSDDEEITTTTTTTHSLSNLQFNHQRGSLLYNNSSGKAKVHECAICGAEFSSGQALGGHMRRHRAVPAGTNTALSLTPMAVESEDQRRAKRQRSVLSLNLDLNLPAPQEHDQRESKFAIKSNQQQQQQQQHNKQQQQQKQQQQPLVFPARTLVDCHY